MTYTLLILDSKSSNEYTTNAATFGTSSDARKYIEVSARSTMSI